VLQVRDGSVSDNAARRERTGHESTQSGVIGWIEPKDELLAPLVAFGVPMGRLQPAGAGDAGGLHADSWAAEQAVDVFPPGQQDRSEGGAVHRLGLAQTPVLRVRVVVEPVLERFDLGSSPIPFAMEVATCVTTVALTLRRLDRV